MTWKQMSCSVTSRLRRAHIRLQRSTDRLYAEGHLPELASAEFLRWLHGEFYRDAPEPMLWIDKGDHGFRMEPGVFRFRSEHDVSVGKHIPPAQRAGGRIDDKVIDWPG